MCLGQDKVSSYLYPIRGQVPSPAALPAGCIFEPRCDFARPECRLAMPEYREASPGHWVRCHFAEEAAGAGVQPPKELVAEMMAQAEKKREPILQIERLKTYYEVPSPKLFDRRKRYVRAVDDVSLMAYRGLTLGIVGESGCGKSTLARTIIGLERATDGKMEFLGFDIRRPVSKRDIELIKNMQMVFQNPDSTLNPAFSVGRQIARPLQLFSVVPKERIRDEVIRLLALMKLGPEYYDRLPRQLSGGEKQRVGIARALAGRPELVLCDEPVSALDVSVQAAVLNLLLEVQYKLGTTLVFIAHDLSVVRFLSDYIAVMYLGKVMEFGTAEQIYAPPYHPYTEALLSAVPIPDPRAEQKHVRLEGTVPSALNPPSGCRFHTRCPRKLGEICEREEPPWQDAGDGHRIYCHIPLEELRKVEPVITLRAANAVKAR